MCGGPGYGGAGINWRIELCDLCNEPRGWPICDWHGAVICFACGKLNAKDW